MQTRIDKINNGKADATFLAISGLKRLAMDHVAAEVLSTDIMLPAVGQGALLITCRTSDTSLSNLLSELNHPESAHQVNAERAMLRELDGSCATPIAGLASISGKNLYLRGLVARPDGTKIWKSSCKGKLTDAGAIGQNLGIELRSTIGNDFFKKLNS